MARRGFTLIEILLVTALIAVLSLTVFKCLSNGIKLWERSRQVVLEEDVTFFFDRMASDLRNTFVFSTLAMEGEEYSFSFPTVVLTKADRVGARAAEGFVDQMGRVRYAFDAAKREIVRQQANYSDGIRKEWAAPQVLASGVKELRFKYYYAGRKDHQLHVNNGEVLPSGVLVEVRFVEGVEEKILSRFVAIPLGT